MVQIASGVQSGKSSSPQSACITRTGHADQFASSPSPASASVGFPPGKWGRKWQIVLWRNHEAIIDCRCKATNRTVAQEEPLPILVFQGMLRTMMRFTWLPRGGLAYVVVAPQLTSMREVMRDTKLPGHSLIITEPAASIHEYI